MADGEVQVTAAGSSTGRRVGGRSLLLLTLALLVGLAPLPAAPAIGGPVPTNVATSADAEAVRAAATERTVTYRVLRRGTVDADLGRFAREAARILGDARGWTLGGSVRFRQVSTGGDFDLILASPGAVAAAHPVCSSAYSCRVGRSVLINARNWRNATPAWQATGASIERYREYVINHEVGHFLGFGHLSCPGSGRPAPVMQQQSISLGACTPNGWPVASERSTLGNRLGVRVYDDWIFPDVLRGDTHRDAIHALARAGIATGHADGYYHPTRVVQRAQLASFLARARGLSGSSGSPFPDVPADHTHARSITAVRDAGIVGGYPDGRFQPSSAVTRAQTATFMATAFGLEASGPPPFVDVDETNTHREAIAALAEAGIVEGYANRTFRPNRSITRAEMATMLQRARSAR